MFRAMRSVVVALFALMLAAVAACGSDETDTETETVVRTVREPPPATTRPQAPPDDVPTKPRPKASVPDRGSRTVGLRSFVTPSRNVGCVVAEESARCDIRERAWTPPPPPPTCELDWGQGLTVTPGEAGAFVCAGDTTLDPRNPVLPYGDDVEVGRFTCSSRETGVTCRDGNTGHGFFLARERYDLF